MKLYVYVSPSKAILAGNNESGWKSVELDVSKLSELEREVCAQRVGMCSAVSGDVYGVFQAGQAVATSSHLKQLAAATPEAILADIHEVMAKQEKELVEKKEADAQRQEAIARNNEILNAKRPTYQRAIYHANDKEYHYDTYDTGLTLIQGWDRAHEAAAWSLELQDQSHKNYLEAKALAEKDAREAKEEADKKANAKLERLKSWASTQGSSLLKARLLEGFAWASLARREFVDDRVKDLHLNLAEGDGECQLCIEPSLAQIQTLHFAREMVPEATCGLWEIDLDDTEDVQVQLRLVLTCPDDVEVELWFQTPQD